MRETALRAALSLVLFIAGGCAAPSSDEDASAVASRVQVHLGGDAAAPPSIEGAWQDITLPDVWAIERRLRATSGWYRLEFSIAQPAAETMALYIEHVRPRAVLHVNGERLAEVGVGEQAGIPTGMAPILLPVPASLLHAGTNWVTIRFETSADSIGMLGRVELGATRVLRARYETATAITAGMWQVFLVVGATLASILFVVALRQPSSPSYRWLAAGVALWVFSGSDVLDFVSPFDRVVRGFVRVLAFDLVVPCFVIGVRRGLRLRGRAVEIALLAAVLAHLVLRAAVPPIWRIAVDLAAFGCWIVPLGYLAALLWRARREGVLAGGPAIALLAVVGAVAAAHDLFLLTTRRSALDVSLFVLFPPFAVTVSTVVLGVRLARGLAESEELNRELEQRVAQKHDELESNYTRMRHMEAVRAIAEERERWLRDMHDGLGGQLVSTLALVESGDAPSTQVADALRDALDELRILIDSVDPDEPDLLVGLATLRSRLEPRLARAGLRFDWRVRDLPPLAGDGERVVLQTLRIVQEAITNVVKHAGATTITLASGERAGADGRRGAFVELRDDGRGIAGASRPGRGLRNMRARAAEIGARLDVTTSATGSCVSVWLPARDPAEA